MGSGGFGTRTVRCPVSQVPNTQTVVWALLQNQPIVGAMWPPCLPACGSFHSEFTQLMAGVMWPASLQQLLSPALVYALTISPSVTAVMRPTSLQQLSFGCWFTSESIAGLIWSASLQQLSFGHYFNQPKAGSTWPYFLRQLSFGHRFNHSMVRLDITCDQPFSSSCRSGFNSTSPLPELCGRFFCSNCRLGINSISPSLELRG